MKISVIVPIYKVEKYIEKCIQSLLDQTYTNFEALIVDDGSPDQSISIAKKLIGNDPRFIFLEKENGGQASARNMGLDYATGDYIAFLDSDDYYTVNCFEKCINTFNEKADLDIVLFGYNSVTPEGKVLQEVIPNLVSYYKKNDILLTEETINYSIWNKMYKAKTWKNKRFINDIIYEDKEILPSILYNQNIFLLRDRLYNYVQRIGSTMNSYNPNSLTSMLTIYNSYFSFLTQNRIYPQYEKYYITSYIKYCLYSQSLEIGKYSQDIKSDRKKLLQALDSNLITTLNIIKSFPTKPKYLLSCLLFLKVPGLFKFIFNILKR